MIELVAAAGLVNWLVTTIVVESELARPLRDCVADRRERSRWVEAFGRRMRTPDAADRGVWRWADYLLRCHLCVGVWVAFAEVAWLGPLVGHGVAGFIFSAMLVKAIGHLVLEVRPQAWPSR